MPRGDSEKKDTVRTFVCIEIPDSISERIGNLQTELKAIDAQVSWTRPSNIHLTLKFLGAVEETRIQNVARAVQRAVAGINGFEIEVGGAGCFPSTRNPRVLWIGFSEVPDALRQLYSSLEDELDREGFAREKRKFSPHLTIGRLRGPKNATQLAELLIESGFTAERFSASEVIVMRSDLKPTGSIYTPQAVIKLA
ncbi:MAG TPA: RNA 2',3'-cyclic phosphodiesterase [Blastocatellia bacterium]|nr:RNA 2',3'-cyclic phosphodiesterase [Blastocatellia bacterium]